MNKHIQSLIIGGSILTLLLLACGAPAAGPTPTPNIFAEPTPLPPVCTAAQRAILQAHQHERLYLSSVEITKHAESLPAEPAARVAYVQKYLQDVAGWTQTNLWTLTEQPGALYLTMPPAATPPLTIAATDPSNISILLGLTYALSKAPPAKPVTFILMDPQQPPPAVDAQLSLNGEMRCITTQQHDAFINCLARAGFKYTMWQLEPPCYTTGSQTNFAKLLEKFIRIR